MLKVLKKDTKAFNYKYTELGDIIKAMAESGIDYYQYTATDPLTLKDYIWTVLIDDKGQKSEALRGSEIIKATLNGKTNPAQEMGSSITYARRYSLLMALGWGTEDNDASNYDGAKKVEPHKPMQEVKAGQDATIDYANQAQIEIIKGLLDKLNLSNDIKRGLMKTYTFKKLEDLTKENAEKMIKRLNDMLKAKGGEDGE